MHARLVRSRARACGRNRGVTVVNGSYCGDAQCFQGKVDLRTNE